MRSLPVIALAVAALAAACGAPSAATDLTAEPIAALDPEQPQRSRFGALEFRGGLHLRGPKGFGGWSAARLDGDVLTMLGDTGRWQRLRLRHDGGRLVAVSREADGRLLDLDGKPLSGNKKMADSEGLTRHGGGWAVSFERRHRLWLYAPDLDARPTVLDTPVGLAALNANGGIEAIVALADGRLLLLAEEGGKAWLGAPGTWQTLTWAVSGDYKPTDAALLPNGDVVVLERCYALTCAGARLSLVPAETIKPHAALQGRELARLSRPLRIDNMEGLAVGRGPAGETMLYLVSDDNFSSLQETLLLAFAIVE